MDLALNRAGVFIFAHRCFDFELVSSDRDAQFRVVLFPEPPKNQVFFLGSKREHEGKIKFACGAVPGFVNHGLNMDIFGFDHNS